MECIKTTDGISWEMPEEIPETKCRETVKNMIECIFQIYLNNRETSFEKYVKIQSKNLLCASLEKKSVEILSKILWRDF